MGRHAAGEGFLRGLLQHSPDTEFACVAGSQAHAKEFGEAVATLRPDAKAVWLRPGDNAGIKAWGTIMLPGPDLSAAAWRRRRGAQTAYSLVGITHTTATHGATDLIADMAIAPVQAWDALICTSRAVKSMVEQVLDAQAAYLADRIGANRVAPPQLPVIPLGVDTDAMGVAPSRRGEWRARLGIPETDLVVLYFGRLSAHGKAHPSPMYAALQLAHEELKQRGEMRKLHVVLGGWFANAEQETIFRSAATRLAPDVTLHVVDGRTPEARAGLWGVADVFTLLSDNIQETFGLAPIEAMAAGLPVVVSDWDGFRDTVEDGVQGYRIPTRQAPPGHARDLARRYEDGIDRYDSYIAAVAQFCAVDVRAAAAAFARLFGDADLRRKMSEAARRRAREVYDWRVITAAYRDLWGELAVLRVKADERAPLRAGSEPHPARGDPFRLFQSYPTAILQPTDRISITGRCDASRVDTFLAFPGSSLHPQSLATADEVRHVLEKLGEMGTLACSDIVADFVAVRRPTVFRTLAWLLKHDIIYVVAAD